MDNSLDDCLKIKPGTPFFHVICFFLGETAAREVEITTRTREKDRFACLVATPKHFAKSDLNAKNITFWVA